jgi:alpha-D-ribose 1-methylphosphonate 5-triphosphate synthase subunit PhnH
MPHPSIYTDWRAAKSAAAALANACGAVLLQLDDGRKRVILGKQVHTLNTWLACWSLLFRIRCDQVRHNPSNPA